MSARQAWEAATRSHHETIRDYLEAARSVPDVHWDEAPREGKWSPAEITQHLILTYRMLADQQETGTAPRVIVPPFKAWMLRTFLLPRLLAGKQFPRGVKAPRDARPGGPIPARRELLANLESASERFRVAYEAARNRAGARATHPFFGNVPLVQMYRFASLHTAHHGRQLDGAARTTA